jgi:hypothetical protein
VYPDDAAEIKAHPFFDGIDWEHLHLMPPPFVPRVREHQSITKYFEEEEEILRGSGGVDPTDAPSDSDSEPDEVGSVSGVNVGGQNSGLDCAPSAKGDQNSCGAQQNDEVQPSKVTDQGSSSHNHRQNKTRPHTEEQKDDSTLPSKKRRPKRIQRRARDKVLRDPSTARIVLDLRKKNAFFGYTYRRPKPLPLIEYEGRWGLASVFQYSEDDAFATSVYSNEDDGEGEGEERP